MAKIIQSDVKSRSVSPLYGFWWNIIIGLLAGLLFWVLTVIIKNYFIEPIFCHSYKTLVCLNSVSVAGNITTIMIAILSILIMVKNRMTQPLIVSVAVGAALWGLASWTIGLSVIEIIFWNIAVYILAYLLFSWIVRYSRIALVVISIVTVIGVMYITTSL